MTSIKILGMGDARTQQLKENVVQALHLYPVEHKLTEVSELNEIFSSGVSETPALLFDNQIVSEGMVLSAEEIAQLLKNRLLVKSKLFRLKKILVPVDYSELSECAFKFAYVIAKKYDATLDLVHVYSSVFEGNTPSPSGFLGSYRQSLEADLAAFVTNMKKEMDLPDEAAPGAEGVKVSYSATAGYPEIVLSELSEKYDLVVMGTTGKGGAIAKLMGTVSTYVAENAHAPVLLVPRGCVFNGFHHVLYASNFESLDSLKIKQVTSFAAKFNGQVHFVHVGPPAEKGIDLERKLFEIDYKYANADYPFHFTKMVGDNVVDTLQEYAFYHKVNLFVFVTQHRSAWKELLHKSNTKNMLLNTSIPVLVVHYDDDAV